MEWGQYIPTKVSRMYSHFKRYTLDLNLRCSLSGPFRSIECITHGNEILMDLKVLIPHFIELTIKKLPKIVKF